MSASDDNYTAVLLDEIRDQNKAVLEAVSQMQDKMAILATQESLDALDAKVTTIQRAVVETNQNVANLGRRVTILEQTT